MDIYKKALKEHLRFNTSKGALSTEQVFDLSQKDLSSEIRKIKKVLKDTDDDELSFLDGTKNVDATEQLRFDILKDVYLTKKEESEVASKAKENKEFKEKILDLIAEKKNEDLKSKSVEELQEMIKGK